jgi:hypothetical protein
MFELITLYSKTVFFSITGLKKINISGDTKIYIAFFNSKLSANISLHLAVTIIPETCNTPIPLEYKSPTLLAEPMIWFRFFLYICDVQNIKVFQ